MNLIFRTSLRIIELSRYHTYEVQGTRRTFSSVHAARSFLRGCASDAWDLTALRRFLSEEMSFRRIAALTDHEVFERIAQQLVSGRIHVTERSIEPLRLVNRSRHASEDVEAPPVPTEAPPSPQTDLAWIRLRVIHAGTGAPIPGIRLHVTLTDDTEHDVTTDDDGQVEFRDIDPGICMVTCPLQDARLRDTYAFAGQGEITLPSGGDGAATSASAAEGKPVFRSRIARIEAHKVKTGASLKSIAEDHGMTWQELALFNWDTAEPDAINEHLRNEVGCTKKTPDGYNYVFDDADEPGLLYIPTVWEQTALVTEQTHTFRVKQADGFRIILENWDGHRIPEADYEAKLADGSIRRGRLGRSGIALIEDPPPGPVEVVFPDLDDVEAKSLAVCARCALDTEDVIQVSRLLKNAPDMVNLAIAAYDQYFNTYTGNGFLEDVHQVFTDPLARVAIEGLLALREMDPLADDNEEAAMMEAIDA